MRKREPQGLSVLDRKGNPTKSPVISLLAGCYALGNYIAAFIIRGTLDYREKQIIERVSHYVCFLPAY